MNANDIVGQQFGYLTVLDYSGRHGARPMYRCRCICGSERNYGRSNLRSGGTKSCGCKSIELQLVKRIRHGMNNTKTYAVWEAMIQRCTNPRWKAFKNYGGRGITVCERWRAFENFFADMGEAPSGLQLDRIDNNLGYFKDNCRWATPLVNSRNRRPNVLITWKGETHCVSEWAEITGILDETIRYRFHKGWAPEAIFNTSPVGRGRPRGKTKTRHESKRMVEPARTHAERVQQV